ncbi:hypothetical protein L7F22_037495 [Adiantum nelumboides]|nr:hypothetical protein [Adiantum nelumboides]
MAETPQEERICFDSARTPHICSTKWVDSKVEVEGEDTGFARIQGLQRVLCKNFGLINLEELDKNYEKDMYLASGQADIAHAVGVVSRFMANPGRLHWDAVKSIMSYLKGTKNKCLCYGGAVSWCSRLQKIVALSMTEAEYISATEASKEAIWLARLCGEFGLPDKASMLGCDSQSAICLAKNAMFHARTKHIDVRYHFIREVLEDGLITLVKVKCWQIRKQTKAPQAAGAIHSDFERGFICAEVMKFDDLKELGSEAAVKAAGKYKQEGKTYVVQDGDVIFFKFNVTSAGKK